MRTTPKIGVALLALLTAFTATPLPAPVRAQAAPLPRHSPGTIGIAVGDAPADAAHDPRAHRYIVGHLAPGSSTTRRLEVSNDTDSGRRIEIYAEPAAVRGGRFLPAEFGTSSALTRRIRVDKPVIHLAPHTRADVLVTISTPGVVPSSAEEQYAVIWASHTSSAAVAPPGGSAAGSLGSLGSGSTSGSPQSAGVDAISRVGVRVYLSTGDEPPATPDFQIVDLRPVLDALGAAVVVASVANIGGRALDLAGTLELTDGPGGLSTPPIPADPVTIGPGQSTEIPFRLAPGAVLPAGEWRATLELSSGAVKRQTVQSVSLTPSPAGEVARPSPTERASRADTALAAVLALAALGTLLLLLWRVRARETRR